MDKRLRTGIIGVGIGSAASLLAWGTVALVRRRSSSKAELDPELVTAITIAVLQHRKWLGRKFTPLPSIRPHETTPHPNNWVVQGRLQQTRGWHPRQR